MDDDIRVVLFGLGSLGTAIAKGILDKRGLKIVGVVDIARNLGGQDLGEVLQVGKKTGVLVTNDAERLLSRTKPHIAIIATKSALEDIISELVLCANAGVDVVSTCEQLSYPFHRHSELSRKIDQLAKKKGVTILGTGINPGYLMDLLPITLTGACLQVHSIKITRMMNSAKRRISYQKKVGTGLTLKQFEQMIRDGIITGHVGLSESTAMIAAALGWKLDEIMELPPEPFVAKRQTVTSYTIVKPGCVTGLKSMAYGIMQGKKVITQEFISHADVEEEFDAISIEGLHNINQRIIGGVHGDVGTVAVVLNMIPKVLNAQPGLVTMKDLPPPSALMGDVRSHVRLQ